MSAILDYYGLLEVGDEADAAEIKRAYHRLARRLHPDVTGGDAEAAERFKVVHTAYTVLTDPVRRRAYDRVRRVRADLDGFSAAGSTSSDELPVDEHSFAALFDLGAGAQRAVALQVRLTFRQALVGGATTVRLPSGDTLRLPVPRGARNGQRIRLQSRAAGAEGDLDVTFRVEPDARFRREGDDLLVTECVSALEAILGATRSLTNAYGQVVRLPIPPGSQPGDRLRLKGQGVATADGRGDLYVEIQVEVPRDLTEEQRAMLASVARRAGLL